MVVENVEFVEELIEFHEMGPETRGESDYCEGTDERGLMM